MNAKRLIKQLLPPAFFPIFQAFYNKVREIFTGKSHEIEYIPAGWDYVQKHPEIKGWNVPDWVETMVKGNLAYREMSAETNPLVPYKQDLATEDALRDHNRIMILAYTLALASRHKNSISILDWGGALGHLYYPSRALLPSDISLEFHCKDVPLVAEYGARSIPEIHFYSDESCFERSYDVVMANASFYYSQDWQRVFSSMAQASSGFILITRLPIVSKAPSYVCLERLYRFRYNVETLCWILNRSSFITESRRLNLTLVREFITGQAYQIRRAPEQPIFKGFLFQVESV